MRAANLLKDQRTTLKGSAVAFLRRPETWPPVPDYPVVVDIDGSVISAYGDASWDLRVWTGAPVILNFAPVVANDQAKSKVSARNVALFKQVVFWRLLRSVDSFVSVRSFLYDLRPLFRLCSESGVLASDLSKFPSLVDEFYRGLTPAQGRRVLVTLHRLFAHRDEIGFTVLPHDELRRLAATLPAHTDRQTPYIPPRIWRYQIERLGEFIADFEEYRDRLVAFYKACGRLWRKYSEFKPARIRYASYGGSFEGLARHFGVLELIGKWCAMRSSKVEVDSRSFSTYLTLAGYIGMAYVMNFSLMRIGEAWRLKADCLSTEFDGQIGKIYILNGPKEKGSGEIVSWPTSPLVEKAVNMMSLISKLRVEDARRLRIIGAPENFKNPYLALRSYEPWGNGNEDDIVQPLSVRHQPLTYRQVAETYIHLFDVEQLRITKSDWEIARSITPTLDPRKFGPGLIWPLAWHQLRRTGAVNMLSSGIVSEGSLQYSLKHATRAMSLYYGSGFSKIKLDKDAENLYVRTMFEVLGREFETLRDARFVSPYGEMRKAQILQLVSPKDSDELASLAEQGKISWRTTLLGGCTRRGYCPYGGIDNIVRCGGGEGQSPCADALYDRKRRPQIIELRRTIEERFAEARPGSPYSSALEAQIAAINNALKVIDGGAK